MTSNVTRSSNNNHSHIKDTTYSAFKFAIDVGELVPIAATACIAAKKIIDMVETAQRHKTICRQLSQRIERATISIQKNPPTDNVNSAAYENYIKVLKEAEQYINELIKTGNFSERFRKMIKGILKSKDDSEYYNELASRLDAAIQDLQLEHILNADKAAHDCLDVANEMNVEVKKLANAVEIAMISKGVDFSENNIYINPSNIEEEEEPEIRGDNKKITKKLLNGCIAVAVRKVQADDTDQIKRTAKILKLLGTCQYIEIFQGLMKKNDGLYVVTEWAEKGDLEQYLHSNVEINWLQKLKFAAGIASALTFCHEREVLHHDVKSKNVLLDEYLNVKLSNFDMARFSDDATTSLMGTMRNIRWTAPEKLNKNYVPYSKEMDVYSFAIVMWEIAARKEPFYQITDNMGLSEKIIKGERPSPIPNDITRDYAMIMKWSWNSSFRHRPTMYQISYGLHSICKEYKPQTPSFHQNDSSDSLPRPNKYNPLPECQDFDFEAHIDEDIEDEPVRTDIMPAWKDVVKAYQEKNFEKALKGFELYAKSNTEVTYFASYNAGCLLYEKFNGESKNELQALIYFREAADHLPADNKYASRAQYLYAEICLKGTTLYDPENGIKYLKKAVDASYPNALYFYGTILLNGEHGLKINDAKAKEMFEKAKKHGHKQADEMLKKIKLKQTQN